MQPTGRVIRQTIQSHPGRTLTNLEGIFVGHNRTLSEKENSPKLGTGHRQQSLDTFRPNGRTTGNNLHQFYSRV